MVPILGTTFLISAILGDQTKSALTPLAADRPGFSLGPGIVQKGKFQFEVGYHQNLGAAGSVFDLGDGAVLRYGVVADKLEVRIGLPSSLHASSGAGTTSGFGDSSLGIKYLLAPGKGKTIPTLGVILTDTFGTGVAAFSSAKAQPQLRLLSSWALSDTQSVTFNAIAGQVSNGAGGLFKQTAFSALYSQTYGAFSPYLELYALLPPAAAASNSKYAQGGFAYAYTPMIQFDASYALGLNKTASDKTFSFGVGFKF